LENKIDDLEGLNRSKNVEIENMKRALAEMSYENEGMKVIVHSK
jgi:hypothetical protein